MMSFAKRHAIAAVLSVGSIAALAAFLPVSAPTVSEVAQADSREEFCRLFDMTEVFSGIAVDQRVTTPLGSGNVERFMCLRDELGVLVRVSGRVRVFALSEVSAL